MELPRIFESAAIKAALSLAKKAAPFNIPVLISGETGCGKEVIAETVHQNSPRSKSEMVCINCAGMPSELIENELFGSRRGAFTGSLDNKTGLVKQADGSTLFLDELTDMPLLLQSKLLRFLQDKRVRKLGSTTSETVDVRIIAALNKAPEHCLAENRLREDLFYRLNVVHVAVPPLRERREDIIPLAEAYLHHFSYQFKRKPPVISNEAGRALLAHRWPGNIRQLANEMAQCALLCGSVINQCDLQLCRYPHSNQLDIQRWTAVDLGTLPVKQQHTVKHLVEALVSCDFNQKEARKKLGLSRPGLYYKIKKYRVILPTNTALTAKQRTPHCNAGANPSNAAPPS